MVTFGLLKREHVSCSLNSLKGGYIRDSIGVYYMGDDWGY